MFKTRSKHNIVLNTPQAASRARPYTQSQYRSWKLIVTRNFLKRRNFPAIEETSASFFNHEFSRVVNSFEKVHGKLASSGL